MAIFLCPELPVSLPSGALWTGNEKCISGVIIVAKTGAKDPVCPG